MKTSSLTLRQTTDALDLLAPLSLAEEWDNVGLLVEPPRTGRIRRVLLTIDLTETVAHEARTVGAQLVVAYHPPIFEPVRAFSASVPMHRAIMSLVRDRIAVYSPHTALDAVAGGVNDWLAAGLGPGVCRPLTPSVDGDSEGAGQGRLLVLDRPVGTATFVQRVKKHLGLKHVRVARPASGHRRAGKVQRVGLCAGAGASVLRGARADLYLTGEMNHHDVLAAVGDGRFVVLCEHTNTERGYLAVLRRKLRKATGSKLDVVVSKADRDPVRVV
jgi:dinuclear metal center YbgI/SA1388 family protein